MHEHRIGTVSRRDALKVAGLAAFGWSATTSQALGSPQQATPKSASKRVLRVAHLTDIHIQPERRASDGFIAALHHAQLLADAPGLILTGGDCVMDSFEATDARTKLQWDLWSAAIRNENGLPLRSCIGNHDVWGWNKAKSKTRGDEPNHGKKRAVEMLKLSERYYAFDEAGWRFIVLDSTQSDGGSGYVAYLDEAQFDWLRAMLRDTPPSMPVFVLSHIPILSITTVLWAKQEEGTLNVNPSLMHRDCVEIKTLFDSHSNVRVCVSGHMHLIDRCEYNGVTYLCNGAVSGNWWKGRHKECDEGYAIIDLYDDGTFRNEYVTYGWKADPA